MKIKDPKTICKKFKNILIYSEASEVKAFLKQAINSIVVDHDEVKININEF